MEIELAEIGNLVEIVELHKKSFSKGFSEVLTEADLLNLYNNLLSNKKCAIYVAKQDDKFIGFVAGSSDGKYLPFTMKCRLIIRTFQKFISNPSYLTHILGILKKIFYYAALKIKAELVAIVVKKEHRRMGVGKKLVEHLEKYFIEMGTKTYYVFTTSDEGVYFYRSLGFQQIADIELSGYKGYFLKKIIK